MLEQHVVRCTRCLVVIPPGQEHVSRRGRTSSLCKKCAHVAFACSETVPVSRPTPLQLSTARNAGYLSYIVKQSRCPYPDDPRRTAWLEGRHHAEVLFGRT